MDKEPFDIDVVMARVEKAVAPYPKAAMFELAGDGFNTPFEQLVACIISIRTLDEVTLPAAKRLFARARTAEAISQLTPLEIDRLINPSNFHERKAEQILAIAQQVAAEYGGELPCDREVLLTFGGVGPKCANLALGIACGQAFVSVDVHVHRVTNRWGYIQAATPEKAMVALEAKLPPRYWLDINRLLVPFGKHICTGRLPRCSTCPVLDMCQQVGVEAHR
ncbi:MAG: endonuclease III [Chloroflexi bacterium]|nr:endonuclease III [Chloroflexota bacterium]MCI0643462.1 endonuclease III [Chloroflexota bacterium]MCI0727460.1 endonuclease III [Chloroflexota bacterium]